MRKIVNLGLFIVFFSLSPSPSLKSFAEPAQISPKNFPADSNSLEKNCQDFAMDDTTRDLQSSRGLSDVVIRSETEVCAGQSIEFDATETRYPLGHRVKFIWNFSDGTTQTGAKIQKEFSEPGDHLVKLTVKDIEGIHCSMKTEEKVVQVNAPVVADAGQDARGCVGEPIKFDGSASRSKMPDTLFALWNFGDESEEKGLQVRHAYRNPGIYLATLTVRDALSLTCQPSSDQKTVVISSAPIVSLSVSKSDLCAGEEVIFNASVNDTKRDDLKYFWSFDNGVILTAPSVVKHRFSQAGTYQVTVAVDDNQGTPCSSDSATVPIAVFPPEQCVKGKIRN